MKKFDKSLAEAGAKVVTRAGNPARILCFDAKGEQPIIALVEVDGSEVAYEFKDNGFFLFSDKDIHYNDLLMATEKKEGWINLYGSGETGYIHGAVKDSKGRAEMDINNEFNYIDTVKIEWEE